MKTDSQLFDLFRYFATVFFPSAVAAAIYFDYNRTQEYKKKKSLLLELEQHRKPDQQQ